MSLRTLSIVFASWLASWLSAGRAAADPPVVLRMATVAPEGTLYARAMRSIGAEVEERSQGAVRFKWYFSAIAGDEPQVADRIKRGLLDGTTSSNFVCERISPSMRVLSLPGLFRTRAESAYVAKELTPLFSGEMKRAGFTLLTVIGVGPEIIFSRAPIRNMAQLRAAQLWQWDANESGVAAGRALGLRLSPLPILEAGPAYDQGRVDGFLAYLGGALVYQWARQAAYMIDLRVRYVQACVVVADRALDRLSPANRQLIRDTFAEAQDRYEQLLGQQDEMLLGGLFQRQGVKPLPIDAGFRSEFEAAAQKARQELSESWIARPLLDRVLRLLLAYRDRRTGEH
jgi:TRAP-type C4-dicarboxylate transport system substrate-binding protein